MASTTTAISADDATHLHGASHLAVAWLHQDPIQALANFTWINNVTQGAAFCRFATAGEHNCLARHLGLPFTAISVEGVVPVLVQRLAGTLLTPGESATTLAPRRILDLLEASVQVLEVRPEWQMLHQADPARLDPGGARLLTPAELPAMQALALIGDAMVFSADSLPRGAFYGVEVDGELVAMGGVQTSLPGFSEIGSIVTHPLHRRRGYAGQVVAALIRHLANEGARTFLCLFQTNQTARPLYEKLGFAVINDLYLVNWQIADSR